MELEEVIATRRSIRRFTNQPIPKELLEKIIQAGNFAPSHCNSQAWKFIVVDDSAIKQSLVERGGSPIIKNAPYGILVLYNTAESDNLEYRDWLQSASAAIQNMLLTIHNLGLGGCWICHLPRKKSLIKVFKVKKSYQPVAYIALGYPAHAPVTIPRKHSISELYCKNTFIWPAVKTPLTIRLKRLGKKLYFLSPRIIKKIVAPAVEKFIKKFEN